MTPFLIFAGLAVLAVAVLAIVFTMTRKRGLSGASRAKVATAWKHAAGMQDPVRRVLEADKVLDLALTELGFAGSLGDKMKRAGPRFSNANALWRAHKLRNQLAHETGAQVSEAEAQSALRAFEKAIADLG